MKITIVMLNLVKKCSNKILLLLKQGILFMNEMQHTVVSRGLRHEVGGKTSTDGSADA